MPTDELASRLRLLESKVLSDLDVRVALLEKAVLATSEDKTELASQARTNNVPIRMALVEDRVKGLNRLMWLILVAILTGAIATNVQLFLVRGAH
jgi:hypothetical protein